jgi:hypothetical protein
LRCSHIDNHPQEGLARFGYKSIMKVEILLSVGYLLEPVLEIWQFLFLQNVANCGFF